MRLLPRSHIPSRLIEDSYVIVLCNLARQLRAELLPEWVPTYGFSLHLPVCGRALIAAVEEAVGIFLDDRSHPEVLWSINDVRCDDRASLQVDIDAPEGWIREHLVEMLPVLRIRLDTPAVTHEMGPDHGHIWVALKKCLKEILLT